MTISGFWIGVVAVIFLMLIGLLVNNSDRDHKSDTIGHMIVLLAFGVIVGMIVGRILA